MANTFLEALHNLEMSSPAPRSPGSLTVRERRRDPSRYVRMDEALQLWKHDRRMNEARLWAQYFPFGREPDGSASPNPESAHPLAPGAFQQLCNPSHTLPGAQVIYFPKADL